MVRQLRTWFRNRFLKEVCKNFQGSLDAQSPDEYPGDYWGHFIEIYKQLCTEMNALQQARWRAHAFFMGIHTLILTGLWISKGAGGGALPQITIDIDMMVTTLKFGFVMTVLWWLNAMGLRFRTHVKLIFIGMMEKQMPAAPHKAEYEAVTEYLGVFRKIFFLFEPLVPVPFGLLYLKLLGVSFWGLL